MRLQSLEGLKNVGVRKLLVLVCSELFFTKIIEMYCARNFRYD